MSDYEKLGHMRLMPLSEILQRTRPAYYIPQHAVWQNADGHRKGPPVFNESQKTTSGAALNHLLYTIPKL